MEIKYQSLYLSKYGYTAGPNSRTAGLGYARLDQAEMSRIALFFSGVTSRCGPMYVFCVVEEEDEDRSGARAKKGARSPAAGH